MKLKVPCNFLTWSSTSCHLYDSSSIAYEVPEHSFPVIASGSWRIQTAVPVARIIIVLSYLEHSTNEGCPNCFVDDLAYTLVSHNVWLGVHR